MRRKGQFLIRIDQEGRANYHAVHGLRQAIALVHVYSGHNRQIAVLDAAGRVVWRASDRAGT